MTNKLAKPIKISFIGGGNMAKALISGLFGGHKSDIHVVDINTALLSQLEAQFNVSTSSEIDDQITQSDVVLLSVKPQHMREITEKLAPYLSKRSNQPLIISIAAGIRALDLSRWLGDYAAIVRTMPNTPALINMGITGMYATPEVSADQRVIADSIMCAVGKTVWLDDEALLDPLTAISGCGPAYVFYFIESMQKAAEEMGLSPEQGHELALGTFLGASQLAKQSNELLSVLRERVTSKGGATNAAINSMEQSGVGDAIVTAVKIACERAKELGNEVGR